MKLAHWLPALLPLLAPALAHAGLQYEVTPLGSGRIQQGRITGLNNLGVAVGSYAPLGSQTETGFISQNGTLSQLPASFRPFAINDHGVIAGSAKLEGLINAATYANGTVTNLGNLGHDWYGHASTALAINNAGQVVGFARQLNEMPAGAIFTGGQVIDIGSLSAGFATRINDINEGSLMVGEGVRNGGYGRAFTYENGKMTDLGTLGGLSSAALAVNNRGDIVGYSDTAIDTNYHAFLYSNGQMHDLGVPAGADQVNATGINDHGTIIGVWAAGSSVTPFIYADGAMHAATDLLVDPKWTVKTVHAINDNDQIAATVCRGWGDCTLAVLSPVPEPGTYGMLLAGLGVVGVALRRRGNEA